MQVVKMKVFIWITLCAFFLFGVSGADTDRVSVKEGDSVTLNTGVKVTQKDDRIKWFFNHTRIAQIIGDQSKICTDVQCNEGTERFRDRLKLDNQTGSLTITNTRNTDSGLYTLHIIINSSSRFKHFTVDVTGISAAEQEKEERIAQKEGESSESSDHAVPDSGPSSAAVAGICVAVVLLVAAASAAVIYCKRNRSII